MDPSLDDRVGFWHLHDVVLSTFLSKLSSTAALPAQINALSTRNVRFWFLLSSLFYPDTELVSFAEMPPLIKDSCKGPLGIVRRAHARISDRRGRWNQICDNFRRCTFQINSKNPPKRLSNSFQMSLCLIPWSFHQSATSSCFFRQSPLSTCSTFDWRKSDEEPFFCVFVKTRQIELGNPTRPGKPPPPPAREERNWKR